MLCPFSVERSPLYGESIVNNLVRVLNFLLYSIHFGLTGVRRHLICNVDQVGDARSRVCTQIENRNAVATQASTASSETSTTSVLQGSGFHRPSLSGSIGRYIEVIIDLHTDRVIEMIGDRRGERLMTVPRILFLNNPVYN